MSNFALYMIGVLLVAVALGYAAFLGGIPLPWIAVVGVLVVGFGVMGAIKKTRRREPSEIEQH